MRSGTRLRAIFYLALSALPGLIGCAAVPVAVAGAGSGISFTSATAHRSFTYSMPQVHEAALQALDHMQIQKVTYEKNAHAIKIQGKTKHLTIHITLVPITPNLTEASVNAKKNWLMKDQSVAAEILIQMDQILGRDNAGAAKR